jgi:membrane protein required for colicin V production
MHILDLICIAVLTFFTTFGLMKGFFRSLIGIVSFVLAFFIATSQMEPFAKALVKLTGLPTAFAYFLSYFVLFFGVIFIARMFSGTLTKAMSAISLGWFNRVLGGIFGFGFGAFLLSVIFALILLLPFSDKLLQGSEKAQVYSEITKFAPAAYGVINKIFPNSKSFYEQFSGGLTEKLQSLPTGEGGDIPIPEGLKDIFQQKQEAAAGSAPQAELGGSYKAALDLLGIDSSQVEKKSMDDILKKAR